MRKRVDLQALLYELFEFTEQDIEENRNGYLTESQAQRIKDHHEDETRMIWNGLLIFTGLGFLGSAGAAWQAGEPVIDMWITVGIAANIVFLFVWAIIAYNRWWMLRTLRKGHIAKIRGKIGLVREGNKPKFHFLRVANQSFEITERKYHQLEQIGVRDAEAVVYYTAGGWRAILSIKLLNGD